MALTNLELMRGLVGNLQAMFEHFDEDVVMDNTLNLGVPADEHQVVEGKGNVTRQVATWVGTWDGYRFEVDDLLDAGENVILEVRESGRGKSSGAEMTNHYWLVCGFRDALIVSLTTLQSREDALEVAGSRRLGA
jgi:ketosteroid isomerase-like protein